MSTPEMLNSIDQRDNEVWPDWEKDHHWLQISDDVSCHLVPKDGFKHEASAACACNPDVEWTGPDGELLWVHWEVPSGSDSPA